MKEADTRPIDLKRFWKQFAKRFWIIIVAAAIGAAAGFGIYKAVSAVKNGNTVYRIRNDYYITYNIKEYPEGINHYNAYTWDGILRDDPIVDRALLEDPSITKEQIYESVTGEMLSDYRILTVVVTGTDRDLIRSISDAYKVALPEFVDMIVELSSIEILKDADIEVYDAYTRDLNAALLGGLIGLFVSIIALLFYCIFDDRIYTERDWALRYPDIPFLGRRDTDEYNVNRSHILKYDGNYIEYAADELKFEEAEFDRLRSSDGVIIRLRTGRDKTDVMDKVLLTLKKQDVSVVGVIEE